MTSSFLLRKKESCPAGFSACGGLHQQHFHLRRSAILRSIYVIGKNFHALAWQGLSYNRTKWASPLQLPPTPQSLRGASLFARRRNTASRWNSSLRRVHPARRAFYCIGNEVSYTIKKLLPESPTEGFIFYDRNGFPAIFIWAYAGIIRIRLRV